MACRTVFLIASFLAALGQQTPTLPRLPLTTYPPAMRDAISRAYRDAETRPRDGTAAGVLALMVDTTGFAARFFAEAMEETDKGPREALSALGASRSGIIFSSVIPQAMPSMINTSLFSLEKATRGSVVLGLVGAGGIGIELKVSLAMFDYDQAATIIIAIFLLVLVVERASTWVRNRIL